MKKYILFLFVVFVSYSKAWSNDIYSSAPGFTVPVGDIAYLGSFYDPEKYIWKTGSKNTYLKAGLLQAPPAGQAVSEVDAAFQKNADKWALKATSVPVPREDLLALLVQVIRPELALKYPMSLKKLQDLADGKPYVLVGVIDFYGTFGCQVNIRKKSDGKDIDYFKMRSILEQDGDMFTTRGYNKVGAFELFLFSTKDKSLLWHANGCDSFQHLVLNSFWDSANHEMEQFVKRLTGRKN